MLYKFEPARLEMFQALVEKMWVKKTEEEIKQEEIESGRSLGPPFFIVSLVLFVQLVDGFSCGQYGKGNLGQCWSEQEFLKRMPMIVLTALGIFFAIVVIRRGFPTAFTITNIETIVCDKCGKVKSNDGVFDCKCGGRCQNLKKMKWASPEPAPFKQEAKHKTNSKDIILGIILGLGLIMGVPFLAALIFNIFNR